MNVVHKSQERGFRFSQGSIIAAPRLFGTADTCCFVRGVETWTPGSLASSLAGALPLVSAIAGQIGTQQQAKIGVFGPVVNQGSRIEGMTRQFNVNICIDETTADFVRRLLPPEEGRCRNLARVRPNGMDTPLLVCELLPPESEGQIVTADVIKHYEAALKAVIDGKWGQAMQTLQAVPDADGPKQFLLAQMARFDNAPPASHQTKAVRDRRSKSAVAPSAVRAGCGGATK
jgi:hypothetical protein